MPDVSVQTDGMEIIFDTDVKNITTSDFDQAVQIADNIIFKTRESQDPYYALEAIRQMDRFRNLVGIAKAKVLHFLHNYWSEFQIKSPFLETMIAYSGLSHPEVVKRYIKIWDMFDKKLIPEEFLEEIKNKPINDLTPIMGAIVSGYELNDDDWAEIAHRKGNSEISKYIRENVKQIEPLTRAIFYSLDKESGVLYAITNGTRYSIGRIILRDQEEPAKRAITRLLETMNVIINEGEDEI